MAGKGQAAKGAPWVGSGSGASGVGGRDWVWGPRKRHWTQGLGKSMGQGHPRIRPQIPQGGVDGLTATQVQI